MPITEDEVKEFLKQWVRTYESGSKEFFDAFTKDATFFTISSPTRIDGLEEFRRGFEPQLTEGGVRRRSQILSPEIRIFGDAALVSYHNRIAVNGKTHNLRGTVTIVKGPQDRLRIAHLHNSYQRAPEVNFLGRSVDEITVLEERVATAAAAVGTPK